MAEVSENEVPEKVKADQVIAPLKPQYTRGEKPGWNQFKVEVSYLGKNYWAEAVSAKEVAHKVWILMGSPTIDAVRQEADQAI
jgi:hypothetical protein